MEDNINKRQKFYPQKDSALSFVECMSPYRLRDSEK